MYRMASLKVEVYYNTWINYSEIIKYKYFGPYHHSILTGKYENLKRLYQHGININQSLHGWTALHLAAELGDATGTALLLHYGANPKLYCENPKLLNNIQSACPLMFALKSGCCQTAKLLMENVKDQVNEYIVGQGQFFSYLHTAVYLNNIEMVRTLLECGARVDAIDSWEKTPLYVSSDLGYTEIAKLLLQYGADPRHINGYSGTAILASIRSNKESTFKLLLEHTTDLNDQDDNIRESPLHVAIKLGRQNMIDDLIEAGVEIDLRTTLGKTALHYAVQALDLRSVKLLCDRGADLHSIDYRGRTPLHLVVKLSSNNNHNNNNNNNNYCYYDNNDIKNAAIEEYGIIYNLQRQQLVLAELLARGANIDIKNIFRRTVLDSAIVASVVDNNWQGNNMSIGWRILENCIEQLLLCKAKYPKLYVGNDDSAYRKPAVIKLFAKYFIKRQVLGLDLDDNARDLIKLQDMDEFKEECVKEARKMKRRRFGKRISVYNFLKSSRSGLVSCTKFADFDDMFYSDKIDREFPIYKSFIKLKYAFAKRYEFHDKAAKCFYELSGFMLPDLVVDEILDYVTDSDKINIIKAGC